MMKEYLLVKAKKKNWRNLPKKYQWIEGLLFTQDEVGYCISSGPISANNYSEIVSDWSDIDETTICRSTGLEVDGVLLFENDIIEYVSETGDYINTATIKYGRYASNCNINLGFYLDWEKALDFRSDLVWWLENREVKFIGNALNNVE